MNIESTSQIEMNEAYVIERAKDGDAAAFETLYNAHCKHVFSVCMRMLKNIEEAEDLTQQVFLRLFRKIGTFRGDSSFSTWLHRVAVNAVLMHLRRKKRTDNLVDSLDEVDANGDAQREFGPGDTSMLGAIDRLNLRRAIGELPAGSKRLFLLHDVFGFKHGEIAGLLGCSAGCSKSQVHRARKRLRHLLQGEEWQAATAR